MDQVYWRAPEAVWEDPEAAQRCAGLALDAAARKATRTKPRGKAPELLISGPWDEGGWHHLKSVEMPNLACKDLEELHQEFHLAVARLRQKAWLIHSFFAQAGLPLETT